uniref:Uncharacterized protein n=1 Tax=Bionectria ochroleuca TaxID=29856 RepID=A0A8H7NJI3_BIOOC
MASEETLPLTRAECSGFDALTINIHTIKNEWLENVNINEHRRQSDNLVASLWQNIPQGRLAADRPDYAELDEHDTATTDDAEPDEEEKLEEEKTILIDDEDAEEDESTSDFEVDNVDSDDASITGSEMSGLMRMRENGGDNVESDEDVVSEYENSDEDEGEDEDDDGDDDGDDEQAFS